MRLPWPFGPRTAPADPTSGDPGAGAGGASAPGGSQATGPMAAAPAPTGAWSQLPPIQRTTSGAPLVAPSAPFLAEVPGARPLPPIVQPLGHEASLSAPPGLVLAQVRAVPSLTSGVPLPTRPVQRAAAPGASGAEWSNPDAAEAPAATVAAPATQAAPLPDVQPVRSLGVVPPTAVAVPSARPLTHAESAPAPLPLPAARSTGASPAAPTAQRSASGPGPAFAAATPTDGGARMPGLGEALATEAPRRGAVELPSPASTPGSAARLDLASAPGRRPGLGAPMTSAPPTAIAQRLPASPVSAPAGPPHGVAHDPGSPVPGARSGDPGGSTPGPSIASAASAVPAAPRPLPVLTVARRRTDGPAAPADAPGAAPIGPPRGVPGSAPVQRTAAGSGAPGAGSNASSSAAAAAPGAARTPTAPGPEIRPLVGARPLRPASAQREAATDLPEPLAAAPGSSPVVARWAADPGLPETVTSAPGSPAAEARAQPVAPDAGFTAGPVVSGSVPSSTGMPMPVQRETAGPDGGVTRPGPTSLPGIPLRASPAGVQRAASGAPSAGTARPDPVAQRSASTTQAAGSARSMPLARPAPSVAPGAEAAPWAGATSSGGAAVQRATITGASGIPVATVTATPVVQRIETSLPTVEAAPSPRSESELDELAQALFGRFRTHLRAEVIHEREARGLGFDAF